MPTTNSPDTAPTHCVAVDDGEAVDQPLSCECSMCEAFVTPAGRMTTGDCVQSCHWRLDWTPELGLAAELVEREGRHLCGYERATVYGDYLVRRWGRLAVEAISAIEEHRYWYRAYATDSVVDCPVEFCERPANTGVFADEIDPSVQAAYRAKWEASQSSPLRPRRHDAPAPTPEELIKWIA